MSIREISADWPTPLSLRPPQLVPTGIHLIRVRKTECGQHVSSVIPSKCRSGYTNLPSSWHAAGCLAMRSVVMYSAHAAETAGTYARPFTIRVYFVRFAATNTYPRNSKPRGSEFSSSRG